MTRKRPFSGHFRYIVTVRTIVSLYKFRLDFFTRCFIPRGIRTNVRSRETFPPLPPLRCTTYGYVNKRYVVLFSSQGKRKRRHRGRYVCGKHAMSLSRSTFNCTAAENSGFRAAAGRRGDRGQIKNVHGDKLYTSACVRVREAN